MDLDLAGSVVLVTGASKGIGLAVTRAFVAEGAFVIAGSRDATPEIEELSRTGLVEMVRVDLSTAQGPADLISAASRRGRLDVLVNNVGAVAPRLTGFLDITDEQWLSSLTLNLLAAVRTTRAALPMMLAAGRGSIVSTSSVNAFLADPAVMDYGAAKAALSNFSKALSKEVGPQGVRVNTVSPGPVATDLWLGATGVAATIGRASGRSPQDVAREAADAGVTGRFTMPEEVADLVVFLASDRSGNTTGADVTIDGGLVTTTR